MAPNPLHQALGLDQAKDPNNIADGTYDGKVTADRLVYVDSNDTLSHVLTYTVTGEDGKGKSKDEWFRLGKEPRLADGSKPEKGEVALSDIKNLEGTMNENARDWYFKRFVDLGFPEDVIRAGGVNIGDCKGKEVTFGVKTKNGYSNISFVTGRSIDTSASVPTALEI